MVLFKVSYILARSFCQFFIFAFFVGLRNLHSGLFCKCLIFLVLDLNESCIIIIIIIIILLMQLSLFNLVVMRLTSMFNWFSHPFDILHIIWLLIRSLTFSNLFLLISKNYCTNQLSRKVFFIFWFPVCLVAIPLKMCH